jgi:hypothetical protein
MEHHQADQGQTAAEVAHRREQFELLIGDIRELPEMQRRALLMREMGALSYEQIAEAMDKSVSSVKSLLVRARWGLAEAADARAIPCEEVRAELSDVAEGRRGAASAVTRRHLRACERCSSAETATPGTVVKRSWALLPVAVIGRIKRLLLAPFSSSGGANAAGAGSTAPALIGGSSGALLSGGAALMGKAAAGIAVAALGAAGAVLVDTASSPPNRSAVRGHSSLAGSSGPRALAAATPSRAAHGSSTHRIRPKAVSPAPTSTAAVPQSTTTGSTTAPSAPLVASRTSPAEQPGGDPQTDTTAFVAGPTRTDSAVAADDGSSGQGPTAASASGSSTSAVSAKDPTTGLTPTTATIPSTGH